MSNYGFDADLDTVKESDPRLGHAENLAYLESTDERYPITKISEDLLLAALWFIPTLCALAFGFRLIKVILGA